MNRGKNVFIFSKVMCPNCNNTDLELIQKTKNRVKIYKCNRCNKTIEYIVKANRPHE